MSEFTNAILEANIKADKYRSILAGSGMHPAIAEGLVQLSKRRHYDLLAKESVSVIPMDINLTHFVQPANHGKSFFQYEMEMAKQQNRLSQEDAALLLRGRFSNGNG